MANFARKNKTTRNVFLKFFNKLHNLSYHWIGFFASYRGVHPKHRIMNYHQFFLDNISENDKVLDIGCATGEVAFDLAKKARGVVGIDILPDKIEIAREKNKAHNIEYIAGDATEYLFKNKFDVIILSNVLEHIKKRIVFLNKIKTLAPKILIRVPLLTRDWISCYKKEVGLPYLLDNSHCIEYTEDDFAEEMKVAGLKIESIKIKFGELYAVVSRL